MAVANQLEAAEPLVLTETELRDLETRYVNPAPTMPCSVCGVRDWTLVSVRLGTATWACQNATVRNHPYTKVEWPAGDDRMQFVIAELRAHRALTRRSKPSLVKSEVLSDLVNHHMRRASFYKSCVITGTVPTWETMDLVDKEP